MHIIIRKLIKWSRLAILLLLLSFVFVFSSCTPLTLTFNYKDNPDKVIAVELFTYEVSETEKEAKYAKVLPFEFSRCTLQEKLPVEEIENFIFEIDGFNFYYDHNEGGVPFDQGVCLTYESGRFEVISWGLVQSKIALFVCVYDENCQPLGEGYVGIDSFTLLAVFSNFFETKIEI